MNRIILYVAFFLPIFAQANGITGVVVDKETNQPVPFANIVVEGTALGTATDIDGKFTFANVPYGYVRLTVSCLGYQTTSSADILVTESRTAFAEVRLDPTATKINEVTVKTSPFQKSAESPIALQKIGIAEIETNPGSNRDISKVIQSFPGVGGTPAFRNDIIIRGGGPSENTFYLDGVEIPNINHFATQGASGGPVGIINADLISGVDFYAGAFPAYSNDALSGVFAFTQKNGNPERLKVRAGLGASESSITLDGPAGDKTSYIISVRRSYLQFLFAALELPFLPTFTDYQLKLKRSISPKSELSVISIGALDKFKLNSGIDEPTEQQEYILSYLPVNEQWSYAAGVTYKQYLPRMTMFAVISRNQLHNVSYKYPENDASQPKSQDYVSNEKESKARLEFKTKRLHGFRFQYGALYEHAYYDVFSKQLVAVSNRPQYITYRSDLTIHKYGIFAHVSRKIFNEQVTLSGGLRMDGNTFSDQMAQLYRRPSWRVSASYNPVERISFSTSAGTYFQLPAYTTLGYRDQNSALVNSDAKYIAADHLGAGVSYRPEKSHIISVEGFYKQYRNYPYSISNSVSLASQGADYGIFGAEAISSTAKGLATGAEVSYRLRATNGSAVSLAYTYVRSRSTGRKGELIATAWDSEHLLTATAIYKLKRNWSVGGKFRLVGGLPYTPYNLDASSNVAVWQANGRPVYDFDRYNAERFPAFHQLDLRVDKQYFYDRWSLMLYLDIQNVYNFQSANTDIVVREKDEDGNYIISEDGQYSLRSLANTSGTVLPTIGIMVEF